MLARADEPDEVADADGEEGQAGHRRAARAGTATGRAQQPAHQRAGEQHSESVCHGVVLRRSVMSTPLIGGRRFRRGFNSQRLDGPRRNRAAQHPGHVPVLVIDDHAQLTDTVAVGLRRHQMAVDIAHD
jgi:hypothetical protein